MSTAAPRMADVGFAAAHLFADIDRDGWTEADALELEFLALPFPRRDEMAALRHAGIADHTLSQPATFVKACCAAFLARRRFEFAADGQRAFVIAVRDAGSDVIDCVAWPVGAPEEWARLYGRAFCLNPALLAPLAGAMDLAIRAYRHPQSWLAGHGRGICILDPPAAWHQLASVNTILAEDLEHGSEIEKMLRPPRPHTRVFLSSRQAAPA